MYPNGYCKIWIDETEKVAKERYAGLSEDQVLMLASQEGVEITAATMSPTGIDVELTHTKTAKTLKFEAVPP
jgi:hypothetical protein